MIPFRKNSIKILIISLVFLTTASWSVTANASVASASVIGDFANLVNFFNKNVIGQIKNDFCRNYILGLSGGDWKENEIRSKIGKRICTAYSADLSSAEKIAKEIVDSLNNSVEFSGTEKPGTTTVNNPSPYVYIPENAPSSGTDLNSGQVIYWTNLERLNNFGTSLNLKENNLLKNIAAIRVNDMFSLQYFEHNSPTGDNVSKEAIKNGYQYITIGENIALGNFGGSKELVDAWMNSPGHRANILNKNYTEIGVYASQGVYRGQDVWIAAQIFGKPMAGCREPDISLRDKISKYKVSAESLMNSIKKIDEELKVITSTQEYNLKVAERNTIAGLYNNLAAEIKVLVAEYNKQASDYNNCIKTF
jgi:uncharacterized protein YkwD